MKKLLNITAHTTLEIDSKEYTAEISATVYPAREQTRDYPGDEQEIEIEEIKVFHHGHSQVFKTNQLNKLNYDRCLTAVQNKLESLLENK